jgi:hypothetical protein
MLPGSTVTFVASFHFSLVYPSKGRVKAEKIGDRKSQDLNDLKTEIEQGKNHQRDRETVFSIKEIDTTEYGLKGVRRETCRKVRDREKKTKSIFSTFVKKVGHSSCDCIASLLKTQRPRLETLTWKQVIDVEVETIRSVFSAVVIEVLEEENKIAKVSFIFFSRKR